MPDTKPSDKKDEGWMLSDRGEADLLKFYHEHPEALVKFTDTEDVFRPVEETAAEVANVFCATGEGGGTDPTCGRSDSEGSQRVKTVLERLSPQMRKTASAYLKGVKVHEDSKALTEHLREEGHKVEDNHRQATYVRGTGVLHLTEGVEDEVIAHELGHVLDGRMESISNDHAFKRAWQKEGVKLSDYATANPAEGLAELIRLYMEEGPATITKKVPAMIKALKSMGYRDL